MKKLQKGYSIYVIIPTLSLGQTEKVYFLSQKALRPLVQSNTMGTRMKYDVTMCPGSQRVVGDEFMT